MGQKGFFITGTDTDCGKTYFSCALLATLVQNGFKSAGIKPIASGAKGGFNEDVYQLTQVSNYKLPPSLTTAYLFKPAIAPHIAAREAQELISTDVILDAFNEAQQHRLDYMIVEGCGGVTVPINQEQNIIDVIKALNLPIILVCAIRLGGINQAILTYNTIVEQGLPLLGWVANCLNPNMPFMLDNILAIKQNIQAPLLATISYGNKPNYSIEFINKLTQRGHD